MSTCYEPFALYLKDTGDWQALVSIVRGHGRRELIDCGCLETEDEARGHAEAVARRMERERR